MRTNSLLTTMSSGDTLLLSELEFHPLESDHLFSCLFGGKLLNEVLKNQFLLEVIRVFVVYICKRL